MADQIHCTAYFPLDLDTTEQAGVIGEIKISWQEDALHIQETLKGQVEDLLKDVPDLQEADTILEWLMKSLAVLEDGRFGLGSREFWIVFFRGPQLAGFQADRKQKKPPKLALNVDILRDHSQLVLQSNLTHSEKWTLLQFALLHECLHAEHPSERETEILALQRDWLTQLDVEARDALLSVLAKLERPDAGVCRLRGYVEACCIEPVSEHRIELALSTLAQAKSARDCKCDSSAWNPQLSFWPYFLATVEPALSRFTGVGTPPDLVGNVLWVWPAACVEMLLLGLSALIFFPRDNRRQRESLQPARTFLRSLSRRKPGRGLLITRFLLLALGVIFLVPLDLSFKILPSWVLVQTAQWSDYEIHAMKNLVEDVDTNGLRELMKGGDKLKQIVEMLYQQSNIERDPGKRKDIIRLLCEVLRGEFAADDTTKLDGEEKLTAAAKQDSSQRLIVDATTKLDVVEKLVAAARQENSVSNQRLIVGSLVALARDTAQTVEVRSRALEKMYLLPIEFWEEELYEWAAGFTKGSDAALPEILRKLQKLANTLYERIELSSKKLAVSISARLLSLHPSGSDATKESLALLERALGDQAIRMVAVDEITALVDSLVVSPVSEKGETPGLGKMEYPKLARMLARSSNPNVRSVLERWLTGSHSSRLRKELDGFVLGDAGEMIRGYNYSEILLGYETLFMLATLPESTVLIEVLDELAGNLESRDADRIEKSMRRILSHEETLEALEKPEVQHQILGILLKPGAPVAPEIVESLLLWKDPLRLSRNFGPVICKAIKSDPEQGLKTAKQFLGQLREAPSDSQKVCRIRKNLLDGIFSLAAEEHPSSKAATAFLNASRQSELMEILSQRIIEGGQPEREIGVEIFRERLGYLSRSRNYPGARRFVTDLAKEVRNMSDRELIEIFIHTLWSDIISIAFHSTTDLVLDTVAKVLASDRYPVLQEHALHRLGDFLDYNDGFVHGKLLETLQKNRQTIQPEALLLLFEYFQNFRDTREMVLNWLKSGDPDRVTSAVRAFQRLEPLPYNMLLELDRFHRKAFSALMAAVSQEEAGAARLPGTFKEGLLLANPALVLQPEFKTFLEGRIAQGELYRAPFRLGLLFDRLDRFAGGVPRLIDLLPFWLASPDEDVRLLALKWTARILDAEENADWLWDDLLPLALMSQDQSIRDRILETQRTVYICDQSVPRSALVEFFTGEVGIAQLAGADSLLQEERIELLSLQSLTLFLHGNVDDRKKALSQLLEIDWDAYDPGGCGLERSYRAAAIASRLSLWPDSVSVHPNESLSLWLRLLNSPLFLGSNVSRTLMLSGLVTAVGDTYRTEQLSEAIKTLLELTVTPKRDLWEYAPSRVFPSATPIVTLQILKAVSEIFEYQPDLAGIVQLRVDQEQEIWFPDIYEPSWVDEDGNSRPASTNRACQEVLLDFTDAALRSGNPGLIDYLQLLLKPLNPKRNWSEREMVLTLGELVIENLESRLSEYPRYPGQPEFEDVDNLFQDRLTETAIEILKKCRHVAPDLSLHKYALGKLFRSAADRFWPATKELLWGSGKQELRRYCIDEIEYELRYAAWTNNGLGKPARRALEALEYIGLFGRPDEELSPLEMRRWYNPRLFYILHHPEIKQRLREKIASAARDSSELAQAIGRELASFEERDPLIDPLMYARPPKRLDAAVQLLEKWHPESPQIGWSISMLAIFRLGLKDVLSESCLEIFDQIFGVPSYSSRPVPWTCIRQLVSDSDVRKRFIGWSFFSRPLISDYTLIPEPDEMERNGILSAMDQEVKRLDKRCAPFIRNLIEEMETFSSLTGAEKERLSKLKLLLETRDASR